MLDNQFRETRLYREIKEEGRIEGRQQARDELLPRLVPLLIELDMPVEEIAERLKVEATTVRHVAQQAS
jgi:predicted transposase YdaD